MFWWTFLLQMSYYVCVCLQDFIKIVRLLLAAVSINGLTHSCLEIKVRSGVWTHDTYVNNFGINHMFTKYINEHCKLGLVWFISSSNINPFTLRAAKRGLMILEIFCLQKHFLENFWRRNVDQQPNNNSPSNILWTFTLFLSYHQKYERSRRYHLEELQVLMG